jgi:hypothetical protein
MVRLIDRKGERYDRLVVVERAPNASKKDTNARWLCKCDCGKVVIAYGQDLAKHKVRSCGCWNAERINKHGKSRTPIHRIWISMRRRCSVPTETGYRNYGGRGITYDPSWESFENFYRDMGDRPKGGTLERIDNNGPYCKTNCEWATPKKQHNNKRTNRIITAFGKTQTLMQWSDETGISWTTLRGRIDRYGWPPEEALTRPLQPGRRLEGMVYDSPGGFVAREKLKPKEEIS